MVDFPFEIIYLILLSLPVKSLLRFRSVCKNWCNIIDSLSFANKHLSTLTLAAEEPQIFPLPDRLGHEKALHSFICDSNVVMKESEHPILELCKEGGFINHVAYGLLCFESKRVGEIYLCNPLRGEVLELPQPRAWRNNGLPEEWARYGMGFDCTTNTYKIVRVCAEPVYDWVHTLYKKKFFETEVYTLGTNAWRVIPLPGSFRPASDSHWGVSACGDMHWVHWGYRGEKLLCIMSFDFKKEEFVETPLPQFGYKHYKAFKLINLKGFLAVVSFPSDTNLDIWMLKDYGNTKEWVREYIICTQVWAKEPDNTAVVRSDICFWEGDSSLSVAACSRGLFIEACSRRQVFVLDLETHRIWYIQSPLPESYSFDRSIFGYTGSVLSLRNFGNPVAEPSPEYYFLKTVRLVYASP